MDLSSALAIVPGERVAFVGAGGKTGLALRLLAEAESREWTALFTTTTKLLSSQNGGYPFILTDRLHYDRLAQQVSREGVLVLARKKVDEWDDTVAPPVRKVAGFAPEQVDRLADALSVDLLLVEADGARHRSLKAPAAYEPRLPGTTTLLVALAGLSVLGQPLDSTAVHRPERVAALADVPLGTIVDPALVAAVLEHPEGGRKDRPSGARLVAVLTQAAVERRPQGRRIARRLLSGDCFERVLLLDLRDQASEVEVWKRNAPPAGVHVVVLAAGQAQRMGRNKLLLPLAGKPVVAHAVDAALQCRAAAVWVVLGAEAAAVRQALAERPVRFLHNRHWAEGQSASLRRAVAAVGPVADGILFVAGDMAFVPPAHLDRLIDLFASPRMAVWSGGDGFQSLPALFGREIFGQLMDLRGDVGGRALVGTLPLERIEPVSEPRVLFDLDTPAAYEQARRWLARDDR